MIAQIKERPILFSGAMVRALLDGSKTQTRRVVKDDPGPYWNPQIGHFNPLVIANGGYEAPGPEIYGASDEHHGRKCSHGQPGDRLWVRETFQGPLFDGDRESEYRADPEAFNSPEFCQYAADGGAAPEFMTMDDEWVCRWRPSIHMPRWASRILLEVVSVRVERLQDCSRKDAAAEGIHRYEHFWRDAEYPLDDVAYEPVKGWPTRYSCPVQAYQALWENINGAGSWDANPWVWVVEFKRVTP